MLPAVASVKGSRCLRISRKRDECLSRPRRPVPAPQQYLALCISDLVSAPVGHPNHHHAFQALPQERAMKKIYFVVGSLSLLAASCQRVKTYDIAAEDVKFKKDNAAMVQSITWANQYDSKEEAERALAKKPNDEKAHRTLGILLEDNQQRLTYLEKAVALNPANPMNRYQLARVLARVGRKNEAKEILVKVINERYYYGVTPNAQKFLDEL